MSDDSAELHVKVRHRNKALKLRLVLARFPHADHRSKRHARIHAISQDRFPLRRIEIGPVLPENHILAYL